MITESQPHAMRELTLRSIVLGVLLTVLFTAANVYFGLRVGLTFATAIPAAVISMAVLRGFSDSSIVENNIVQTIGSAAGAVATMVFILPALVIVGWWNDFPYWTTVLVSFLGGTLGVMMSVPMRRALVTGSDLPYPEGVAGAEVLRVGTRDAEGADENRFGLRTIVGGGLIAAAYALLGAMRLVATEVAHSFRLGAGATGVSATMSMGLVGVGHLIGLAAGVAMGIGSIISWFILLPWLSAGVAGPLDEVVGTTFGTQVRFVGAGAIAVAAIWTLLKISGSIFRGLSAIAAAQKVRREGGTLPLTERDLPGTIVLATTILALFPIAWLLWDFVQGGPVADNFVQALIVAVVFIIVIGAVVAAVTGYMAGLVGTSNSPVSGIGILSILIAALLVAAMFGTGATGMDSRPLVAFALFLTAFVFGIGLIANDNLQDLKTGQLVGSTPWKQQVALVIGVGCGSLVIPPVLDLLNGAFGFAGAANAGPNALPAPQASLIASIAQGVLGEGLRWDLLAIGGGIALVVILIDELQARRGGQRLSPLAVAMGMYLPMSLILPTVIGAFIGHVWDRRAERTTRPEFMKRTGVLLATGLIVGDSLFGLLFAASVAGFGDGAMAVVGEDFAGTAELIGLVLFAALVWFAYARTRKVAERT